MERDTELIDPIKIIKELQAKGIGFIITPVHFNPVPNLENSTHPANPLFRKRAIHIRKKLEPIEIDAKLDAMNIVKELEREWK